jgi:hypothetical protein
LTNPPPWCFFIAVEHEKYADSKLEARAGQWLHGHSAARVPSFWQRGYEVLIQGTKF